MKHLLTVTRACYTTVLVAAIALSAYGCADTVSVSPDVAVPLSSLTVSPGGLQPAFSRNTTNYTVDAPTAATSVTVTTVPGSTTDTMTINGVTTAAGQGRSIPLGAPGSTITITIIVFSQTGNETTYTVIVTRLLSSDNNLSALSVTVGNATQPLSPRFVGTILEYTVDVATNVASVVVSATKSDSSAVMLIGSVSVPAGTASGQASTSLGAPGTATPVLIEVTAPNGSKKIYRITVNRAAASNANLSALTVTPPGFFPPPGFVPSTLNYTVDVDTNVTSVEVSATKADPNAVISGDLPNEGHATIPLDGPGTSRVITIIVTAQDTVTIKTYHITVNRAAAAPPSP